MIVDTHVHVVSADKVKHPLPPTASGWIREVSNPTEDYIKLMDAAGVDGATLVQPGAMGPENAYQADSGKQFAPRTVSVGILDPVAPDAADKLTYWIKERGMQGIRLMSQAEADDPRGDALWRRAEALKVPVSLGGGGQPERVDKMRDMLARFPGVNAAPDHFAGWSGNKEQRAEMTRSLAALATLPNAYLRISNTSIGPYASLDQADKDLFKRVIDAFTPQRVMWGSNFPATREGGYTAQVKLAQTALPFLSAEDRRWLFGDTAHKLWPSLRARAK